MARSRYTKGRAKNKNKIKNWRAQRLEEKVQEEIGSGPWVPVRGFIPGGSFIPGGRSSSHAQRSGLLVRELSLDTMEWETPDTLEGG